MAWIEPRPRNDGVTSQLVIWRLGGGRTGPRQFETFGSGSDEQNVARAEGFKKMVEAAGGYWPDGWVKGEGFVRARLDNDPYQAPPAFNEIGEEYVRQIVDTIPGLRGGLVGEDLRRNQRPDRPGRRRGRRHPGADRGRLTEKLLSSWSP